MFLSLYRTQEDMRMPRCWTEIISFVQWFRLDFYYRNNELRHVKLKEDVNGKDMQDR